MTSFVGFSRENSDKFKNSINELKIFSECPEFDVHRNVLLITNKSFNQPEQKINYHCLYSSEGKQIDSSLLRRGKNKQVLVTQSPSSVDLDFSKLPFEKEKYIYIGGYTNHYGHFLTEMTSRLWFYLKHKENYSEYLLLYRGRLPNYALEFFDLIGLDISKLVTFSHNTILNEVVIPYPSFSILSEAYTVHTQVFERAATVALDNNLPKPTNRPLYLSRRNYSKQLSKREVIGEEELEDYFINKGCNIEYFENLNLREQIYLINRHRVIISPIGSALHNLLFLLKNDSSMSKVFALSQNNVSPNYFLIDRLKSIDSFYVHCLKENENRIAMEKRNSHILNVSKIIKVFDTFEKEKLINWS